MGPRDENLAGGTFPDPDEPEGTAAKNLGEGEPLELPALDTESLGELVETVGHLDRMLILTGLLPAVELDLVADLYSELGAFYSEIAAPIEDPGIFESLSQRSQLAHAFAKLNAARADLQRGVASAASRALVAEAQVESALFELRRAPEQI